MLMTLVMAHLFLAVPVSFPLSVFSQIRRTLLHVAASLPKFSKRL
jgi:hypothetical protein